MKILPRLVLIAAGLFITAYLLYEEPYLSSGLMIGAVIVYNQFPKRWSWLPGGRINSLSKPVSSLIDKVKTGDAERIQELEERLQLTNKILNLTPGHLALVDLETNRYLFANEKFASFFGCAQNEMKDFQQGVFERAIQPDDQPIYHDYILKLRTAQVGQSYQAEFRVRNARDEWRWISQTGIIFEVGQSGRGKVWMLTGDDITENRSASDHLQYVSTHDALTGLYNWAYFGDALQQVQKEGLFPAAVVMMDMDNLKIINDTMGHHIGDEYLREIGALLRESFRACDVVARVGGDEFAVLLPWVSETDAQDIVCRVRSRFEIGVTRSGMSLDVLSFGICTAASANELIEARHQADRRMYQDKQRRKLYRSRNLHATSRDHLDSAVGSLAHPARSTYPGC